MLLETKIEDPNEETDQKRYYLLENKVREKEKSFKLKD